MHSGSGHGSGGLVDVGGGDHLAASSGGAGADVASADHLGLGRVVGGGLVSSLGVSSEDVGVLARGSGS